MPMGAYRELAARRADLSQARISSLTHILGWRKKTADRSTAG